MTCILDRDVMEVAKEIVATISDPQGMVGPEVRKSRFHVGFFLGGWGSGV